MKVIFNNKKMDISEELRSHATRKLGKLDRYFKVEGLAHITFSMQRGLHIAEVTVQEGGLLFRASTQTSDMYASLDKSIHAIEQQIHKNRTRLSKKLRDGSLDIPAPAEVGPVEEERSFDIIRTKKFALKPMSPEEAILHMNLIGHQFYMFRNALNESVCAVVYRRNDGGYGLIEEGFDEA